MFGKGTGGDVMPYVQFFVCKLEPERAFLATFHVAAVLHLYLSNSLCTMGLLTYAFVIPSHGARSPSLFWFLFTPLFFYSVLQP